jgi:hypothetical protein
MTAVAGTVFIAAGAFWLSFTSLADLAARSGIGAGQAWAWPLIVDGIIVVATVAVVALAGQRSAWYPWALLVGGALVSVTANAIHAVVAADADVPRMLAASVAAVPPVVLLAITHLTVILTRTPTPTRTCRPPHVVLDDGRCGVDASAAVRRAGVRAVATTLWRIGGRWGGSCGRRAGRTSGSPANSGCIPRPWAAGSPSRTSLTPPTPPTSGRRRPHEHHRQPAAHRPRHAARRPAPAMVPRGAAGAPRARRSDDTPEAVRAAQVARDDKQHARSFAGGAWSGCARPT